MANSIIRWNPFREMAAMRNMMDRFFEDSWRPMLEDDDFNMDVNRMAIDLDEDDQSYNITTELPGVQADNIHVRLDGDYLLIEGEIPEQTVEREGKRALIKERRYGKYSRRIRLPQPVQSDKIEANFENGVLKLTLPKLEEVKPKMIPIKVNGGNK
jgi:HSP20 family protein